MLAYGWRVMFYVFGAIGFVWVAAFWWFYRERPEDHPHVNRAELTQIRGVNADGTIKAVSTARPATPWREILTAPNMWWIALGYCCFFFGTNFYLTWYPTYLREYRGLSIVALGFWGSIPLLAGMAGDVVGGWIVRHDSQAHGQREARPPRRGRAGVSARGRVSAACGDGRRCDDVDPVPRHVVLLPGVGHRAGVGGADGRGAAVSAAR